jgi:amino acid permease
MGTQRGGLAVAIVSTLLPAQGNLSYATVLSYTLQSLLETLQIYWSRVTCLIVLTVFVLLPLCLMKDLNALSPFSALGVASVGVVMVAMIIRCLDGTYQPGGKFYADLGPDVRPSFGDDAELWSTKVLPFVCMVFQSYVMHYNTPRFFFELKDATVPRFREAVFYSFGISSTIYIVIAGAGFLTFGGNSSSYILRNYSPADPLANLSRVGIFFSTLLIYPLAFFGVRDGLLDVFQVPQYLQTERNMNLFKVLVLTVLTIGALLFHDLGLINAVGGGALATFLCFVFPALMYRRAVIQAARQDAYEMRESLVALVLMVVGVILGFVGVYQSVVVAVSDDQK